MKGRSNSKEGQDNSDAWKTSDKRASNSNSVLTNLTRCHNQGRCERSRGSKGGAIVRPGRAMVMHGGQVISAQAAQTARQPNSRPATTKDGARGPRGEREEQQ